MERRGELHIGRFVPVEMPGGAFRIVAFEIDVDAVEPETFNLGDERGKKRIAVIGRERLFRPRPIPIRHRVIDTQQHFDVVRMGPGDEGFDGLIVDVAVGRIFQAAPSTVGNQNCKRWVSELPGRPRHASA